MANLSQYNETTGVMGGAKPTNLSKEEILANAQSMTDGGMCLNSEGKKVGCNTLNQTVVNAPVKGKEYITKKILGAYNQNLIIAVVLVAGYFAYKKFKK
jgi:hypothetical protein